MGQNRTHYLNEDLIPAFEVIWNLNECLSSILTQEFVPVLLKCLSYRGDHTVYGFRSYSFLFDVKASGKDFNLFEEGPLMFYKVLNYVYFCLDELFYFLAVFQAELLAKECM